MSKNFQELLDSLNKTAESTEDMAKSVEAATVADDDTDDDDTIAAAAGEAGAAPAAAAAAAGEGDDGAPVLGKSMQAVDESGNTFDAVDATELIKSLLERQDTNETNMALAVEALSGVLDKQTALIKSLSDKVTALSSQGRGRKAMLSVVEKPSASGVMAKSDEGVTPEMFFAKANTAFDEGKLSGQELNVISVCLRSNHPIPQDLIGKVI